MWNLIYLISLRKERIEHGIDSLPGSLEEAIKYFKEDGFVRETLGDHIYYKLIDAKTKEWDEYRTQVTSWETDNYVQLLIIKPGEWPVFKNCTTQW